TDLESVAERELDEVEALEVPAAPREDVPGQHAAEADAQIHVLAERALVEHLPEPDQRLDRVVAGRVDLRIVLGLERDIAGIHLEQRDAGGFRQLAWVHIPVLRVVDVREDAPAQLVPVAAWVGKLL